MPTRIPEMEEDADEEDNALYGVRENHALNSIGR